MLKQAFAQVGEVSIRVSCRRYALVHLHHMHALPGDLFARQSTQHLPRRVAAANRHDETTALRHGRASFGSDNFGSPAGDCIGIGKYLNLHGNSWMAYSLWLIAYDCLFSSICDKRSAICDFGASFYFVTVGFCQPPGGETF